MTAEPESLLARIKRLRAATPGKGTPADFGALANLIHMSAKDGGPHSLILIGGVALSITKGAAEAMLLDAKAVWYALPEIIEAFECLREADYAGAWTTEQWHAWNDRVRAVLSKVSADGR